jgi:subtilase family serine protease
MPRKSVCPFRKRVVISTSAFLVLAIAAPAQIPNRIAQNIGDTEPVMVSAPHPLARAESDQGRVEGSMQINRAAMVFKLAPAQQSALEKLLAEQQDPHSAKYRKWLTPEQYAGRFGVSDSDLAKVTAWLNSQGLTVNGFSRGRTQVFFSGTAAQVEIAFHTEFHRYLVNREMSFANAIEISVPEAISGMVLGFRGLENFRPQPRARKSKPNFTSHQTGDHFMAPGDFATIYNIPAALDGTGQTIAVVGQTQINTSDIDAFRTAASLPARTASNFLQTLIPGGGTGFKTADEVEANLDLEWSNAVAKKATIIYVYAGANSATLNVFDALAYAIDHNVAPVISTSYGNCEANLTGFVQTLQQEAQQANAQGQTITAASGDSGAGDCDASSATSATHGPAVDAPASVPEVTGIGGSEFTGDAAGTLSGTAPNTIASATAFWGGTTSTTDNLSSALSYIPEKAWNDTTLAASLSATGGGKSTVFSKPSWQAGSGVPNDGSRDVPDISLSASANHDAFLICSQSFFAGKTPAVTSCTTGFRASNGASLAAVGGTSVGAPSFAGIVALLNQKTGSSGLGNINPTLYSLAASTPSAFHDITTGNNNVPCTQGSTGCPTTAPFQYGFIAGTGYDQVTGLGSVNVTNLANAWAALTPSPDFSLGGTQISVPSPGQSGISTITVTGTNGFGGTVALTCVASSLPAGATCMFPPSSVTSGKSTLTISTTAATPAGISNVTVTGTSGSVSHTTSVSLTVISSAADFTIAATALSPAKVSAGGSATSTITIAPTNGFTGSVSLVCRVTGGGTPAPTCSFVPTSVTTGTGTSTMTVSTTAPHALSGAVISPQPGHGFGWLAAGSSALFAGIFFLGVPSRRRRGMQGLGLMLLVFFAAGMGCGGSSSGGGGKTGGTPAGSYTITVTATSASPQLSHTANLAVTVQ